MAATVANLPATPNRHPFDYNEHDAFSGDQPDLSNQAYQHRFSSRFDIDPLDLSSTSSPSQLKRTIEAHLQETDRRLLDTQKLGTSLLKQRDDLTSKLEEIDQVQDEAQIPADLRQRLADIEREHADVGREVARALIGPKAKQDDIPTNDSGVFTSQATASPTKVSAPSRRHRNQPSTKAGDLQFAADISTSLLVQVRQLQAAVAERDETIKHFNVERDSNDRDLQAYSQKIRALDESEQKYKDENWNLETQKHELLMSAKESQDKEKRLNASLGAAIAEKNRLQNDLDEIKITHSKLTEEHAATRKAHDTEIHGLKRNADAADSERQIMQDRIDELMAQNQELAKAISTRSRSRQANPDGESLDAREENAKDLDTPEDSPPPSPTKATPRHGGLESETLRSSLHHAHRMIQNLKGNIHREKTEKIELKRMLQEARDELEQRRGVDNGSAVKRQKTKPDLFKKPARPDMLGGNRRPRTDVELTDDDWEDHNVESPTQLRSNSTLPATRDGTEHVADLSDAYQTANDTEGTFDTADERNTTESEAFMTGAESLAGDSTDELTETEDTASRTHRTAPGRVARTSIAARPPGNRNSYLSTASTSADEADETQTPMQSSFTKFKLRNNRTSYNKPTTFSQQSSPETYRSPSVSHDSPATVMTGQSPSAGEQSLFAELGGMDEINSDTQSLQSTPARSSTISSQHSTPGVPYTPSKSMLIQNSVEKPSMSDSSTMTEAWSPESRVPAAMPEAYGPKADNDNMPKEPNMERSLLPSAFPLPPSVPTSPVRKTDTSTQYTPQRNVAESPIRPGSSYITPPKTVWDEVREATPSPQANRAFGSADQHTQPLGFSGVLSQESTPQDTEDTKDTHAALSRDLEASRNEVLLLRSNLDQKHAQFESVQKGHKEELSALKKEVFERDQAMEQLQASLAVSDSQILTHGQELDRLRQALRISEEQKALLSTLTYSSILSQDTEPMFSQPVSSAITPGNVEVFENAVPAESATPERPRTAEKVIGGSKLISAATLLDSSEFREDESSQIKEGERQASASAQESSMGTAASPARNVSDYTETRSSQKDRASFVPELLKANTSHDQGSQTMLTAEQLEEALRPKKSMFASVPAPVRSHSPNKKTPPSPTRYPGKQPARNREVSPIIEDSTAPAPVPSPQRPASAASNRTSSLLSQQYPPLPADHKDVIAKANIRSGSPSRRESSTLRTGGIMGPPVMPASAMRRPRTPNESVRSPTPQQGSTRKRGTVGSQMSRRSSVSSFASELDERFNIRPDHQAAGHGFAAGPGTDPRMIQAITQTMIGEFLWKYTRKAGSKEMSTTRHRRYFWVHPYTKTLYWSDQDPQTAGRTELKAKSVAIESVRVVSDDNPMPPGLHRKSLEVTTPGRKVKFTASTGQRHETWFNALSYLLNRDEHDKTGTYVESENDITQADIAEFNVNGYGARLVPNDSRMSMSSYNSRTTRGTASNRVSHAGRSSQPAMAGSMTSQNGQALGQSSTAQVNQDTVRRTRPESLQVADRDRTIRASSVSRISKMFGSVTGRTKSENATSASQASSHNRASAGEANSIYDASVVSDGRREEEEEARRRQQEREANAGLEDVRACCDGKHNVGTLTHRQVSTSSTQNRINNAINRSMSRRT